MLAINGRVVTLSDGSQIQWPMSVILPFVGQVVSPLDWMPVSPEIVVFRSGEGHHQGQRSWAHSVPHGQGEKHK